MGAKIVGAASLYSLSLDGSDLPDVKRSLTLLDDTMDE